MKTLHFFIICTIMLMSSCYHTTTAPDLRTTIKTYDRLIMKTDADSISMLYAIGGDLGSMAHGRDSIRKFLLKFKDFKVLEQRSVIDSIHETADSGYVAGTYHQVTLVPAAPNTSKKYDTFSVNGIFHVELIKTDEYGWLIKKMETR